MTIEEYIEQHASPQPDYLDRVERQSNLHLINGRMCSGRFQGRLLKLITSMIRPQRVLELGTFSGFSALCMAEGLPDGATIDTIEIDDEMEDFIITNIAASPYADRIRLHIGAAEQVVGQWEPQTFDLIFLDADKRRYVEDLNLVLPLLRPGGFILADNTLWDGHVIDPARANDPQTRGILEFNQAVASHPDLESVILPLRDGLSIIRRKN